VTSPALILAVKILAAAGWTLIVIAGVAMVLEHHRSQTITDGFLSTGILTVYWHLWVCLPSRRDRRW
jgi:hypothetical protein